VLQALKKGLAALSAVKKVFEGRFLEERESNMNAKQKSYLRKRQGPSWGAGG
jgi:hypothetical protein